MAKRKTTADAERTRAIGRRIAQYRTARGWSQAELASRVDVEPATVSRIETGARPARTVLLLRLASAFQVSVGDLLGDMPTDRVDLDEVQLVEAFRMLDPSLREAVLRIVASLVSPAAAGPPPTLAAPPEPPPEPK